MASFSSPNGAVGTQGLSRLLYGAQEVEKAAEKQSNAAKFGGNEDNDGSVGSEDDEFEDARETQQQDHTFTEDEETSEEEEEEEESPSTESVVEAQPPEDEMVDSSNSEDEDDISDPPAKKITGMDTSRVKAFEEGYDSDGEAPPNNRTQEEEALLEEEKPLGETPVQVTENDDDDDDEEEIREEEPPNEAVDIPENVLLSKGFTVAMIKEELRIRNVTYPARLNKPGLVERLKASLHLPVVNKRGKKGEKKKVKGELKDDMSEFAPGAYWKVLTPLEEGLDEPSNPTFQSARAPTVPEEDAEKPQVAKHNFDQKFERPEYKGTRQIPKVNKHGKVKKNRNGDVVYEKKTRQRGGPKQSFLIRHKLDALSHPAEYLEAFLPLKHNKYKDKHNEPYFSIAIAQQWTNMKALLANAGTDDCYRDFKPFTLKEIQQQLGLLILNGISPSPQIDFKFDRDDPANYNHFVDVSMPNGIRRHRHFKAFFAVQDPRKAVPARRNVPLFKLLPLINWINKVGQVSWDLSINVSIDEQTISFQGRHVDKLRITYKAEGDGFQVNALCDDGFTHSVYFRNEKPPRKYTSEGLSPLHARVMWLFDKIEEEFTRVWMDNLYISAKFAKFAYNHPKHVLIAGVARKNGRGIPLSVLQEEKKDKKEITKVRGTVKAAVLKGDKDMPGLVAVSVYDTKPVHFISTICTCIEWVLKAKQVWNEAKQKMDKLRFLRLNVNDEYNLDMNAVDIADQLRNYYRFDHWLRNFKWWWAIMLWAFGVLLVNAYVTYTKVMDDFHVSKRLSLYSLPVQACMCSCLD